MNKPITSTAQITKGLIDQIYQTDADKEIVQSIVELCKKASTQELRKMFTRLAKTGSAHQLANILHGADGSTFKVYYPLPYMTVYNSNHSVGWIEAYNEKAA